MGITLSTMGGLLAPLHSLMGWFAPAPRHTAMPALRSAARPAMRPAVSRACSPRAAAPAVRHEKPRRPLRIVRVMENANAAGAGRMFMSGRMADVCAELDRLAALEAAAG
jgi:hypothetical protein